MTNCLATKLEVMSMRLPDLRPSDLNDAQRAMYELFAAMPQARPGAGYQVRDDDGAFLGPWGVLMHFADIGRAFVDLVASVDALQGISDSARQVVILTVGGHLNAAYVLYAHAVVAAEAGLRADQIATLSAGGRPADLTGEEHLAADVASALLRGGVVPETLYQEVVGRFGQTAIDTIVFVAIHYSIICLMVNCYDAAPGGPTDWRQRADAHSAGVKS